MRIILHVDADVGDQNRPRTHYNEALKIAREITDLHAIIEALLARGRSSAKRIKKAREAFKDLEEALSYATTGGF